MPLGIVGIALGTAILPMLSRHIHTGDAREAQRLQANAFEIATLLTLPAAAALAVCAPAFCHRLLRRRQVHARPMARSWPRSSSRWSRGCRPM